ncbi:hypothetical protein B9Z55_012380 [Caenorhabditis nigoni]|nr:hypothetical protein B9Z55_012380 [Caenorhabditis nigoni]
MVHDNAKPLTFLKTRQKLQMLGVKIFCHLPQKFHDRKDVKKWLDDVFASRPPEYYANGIGPLPSRWQVVMYTIGEYITH